MRICIQTPDSITCTLTHSRIAWPAIDCRNVPAWLTACRGTRPKRRAWDMKDVILSDAGSKDCARKSTSMSACIHPSIHPSHQALTRELRFHPIREAACRASKDCRANLGFVLSRKTPKQDTAQSHLSPRLWRKTRNMITRIDEIKCACSLPHQNANPWNTAWQS